MPRARPVRLDLWCGHIAYAIRGEPRAVGQERVCHSCDHTGRTLREIIANGNAKAG